MLQEICLRNTAALTTNQLCEFQNGLSDFDMEAEVGLDVHKPIKGYAGS